MTTKELLEIITLVIGVSGFAGTGAFTFATSKYGVAIGKQLNNLQQLQIDIKNQNYESGRKIQKNIDNLIVEMGVVKCDVRDIKSVMVREGLLHDRAGFPEENIPKQTGWTVEDA